MFTVLILDIKLIPNEKLGKTTSTTFLVKEPSEIGAPKVNSIMK